MQLLEDVVQVPVDGALFDGKLPGDVAAGRPVRQEQHDLALAPAQRPAPLACADATHKVRDCVLSLAAEHGAALGRLADRGHQIPRYGRLDEVAQRPGRHRLDNRVMVGTGGENHEARLAEAGCEPADEVNARQARPPNLH
jgi:hypothetical protein